MPFDPFAIYGAGNTNLLWSLEIDWDDSGDFSENEAHNRMVDCFISRGREYFIRPIGDSFEPYADGITICTLDNRDERYNPRNTESPLYPNVGNDKFSQIKTKNGGSGTEYPMIAGKVVDIQPIGRDDWSRVMIYIADGLHDLRDQETNIKIIEDGTVDDAMGDTLDDVAWPARWGRDLDTGQSDFPWLGADKINAFKALDMFAMMDLGRVFCQNDGTFRFVNRGDTSSSVLSIVEAEILKDVAQFRPIEAVRNIVNIISRDRRPFSDPLDTTVYTLDEPVEVLAGQTIVFDVEYEYQGNRVPATGSASSGADVALVNATANTAEDDSGTDLISDFVFAFTPYTFTGQVSITNNSTFTGWATSFLLIGQPGDILREQSSSASGTGASTKPRLLELNWELFQGLMLAQDTAAYLVDFLDTIGDFYKVTYEHRFDKQFIPDIYDVVNLDVPDKGANTENFRVGHIETKWLNENGQAVQTALLLEPFIDFTGFWKFTTQMGTASKFPV